MVKYNSIIIITTITTSCHCTTNSNNKIAVWATFHQIKKENNIWKIHKRQLLLKKITIHKLNIACRNCETTLLQLWKYIVYKNNKVRQYFGQSIKSQVCNIWNLEKEQWEQVVIFASKASFTYSPLPELASKPHCTPWLTSRFFHPSYSAPPCCLLRSSSMLIVQELSLCLWMKRILSLMLPCRGQYQYCCQCGPFHWLLLVPFTHNVIAWVVLVWSRVQKSPPLFPGWLPSAPEAQ